MKRLDLGLARCIMVYIQWRGKVAFSLQPFIFFEESVDGISLGGHICPPVGHLCPPRLLYARTVPQSGKVLIISSHVSAAEG